MFSHIRPINLIRILNFHAANFCLGAAKKESWADEFNLWKTLILGPALAIKFITQLLLKAFFSG